MYRKNNRAFKTKRKKIEANSTTRIRSLKYNNYKITIEINEIL